MPKYVIEVDNIKALELAIDSSIANAKRAINTQKRPEFTVVYEKDIDILNRAKQSITNYKENK